MERVDVTAASREAAQLRYELARLRDRRTVRAALALGELRRAGAGAALAALRGRAPRLDVPGPATTPLRSPFPHLRAVHTGDGHLLASTCANEAVTPATAEVLVRRDRPDLILVDDLTGWSGPSLARLRALAQAASTPIVTLGRSAAAALPDADLRVAEDGSVPGAGLELGPAVDVRRWSPAGLDDAAPPHRRDDAAELTPEHARRQPVVAVSDVAAVGVRRCLELLAAGAVLATGPHPPLAAALGGLSEQVVGPLDTLEERAAALLADDDARQRLSVRLRRHVHRTCSTRSRLIALVETLHLDDRPSERISVLLATNRPQRLPTVVAELAAQSHPDVEVILLPHGDGELPRGLAGVDRVERVSAELPLGRVLNVGLDLAGGAYVAKFDDDDRYGPDHLLDQLLALHHSGAEVVGRRNHGIYDEGRRSTVRPPAGDDERFEDHLPGATMLLPIDVLRSVRWRHVPNGVDTELIRAVHLMGGSAYSGHRFGFVRVRHGQHTYDPEVTWAGAEVAGFDPTLLEA